MVNFFVEMQEKKIKEEKEKNMSEILEEVENYIIQLEKAVMKFGETMDDLRTLLNDINAIDSNSDLRKQWYKKNLQNEFNEIRNKIMPSRAIMEEKIQALKKFYEEHPDVISKLSNQSTTVTKWLKSLK